MITFLATVHILACLSLIALVLMQDSKGGGVFTTQSSSNTVLGATGATTLASTMTKIVSGVLVITCIGLAMLSSRTQSSVVDSAVIPTTPVNAAAAMPASATTEVPAAAMPASATTK
jgi:preprotein translocase subunit SecG